MPETAIQPYPNNAFDPMETQRHIYRWYDHRYSDDAFNIYSADWGRQITLWHEQSPLTDIDKAGYDLEMGSFFRSDPIAAFSLWNLLQVCYELDEAVCSPLANAEKLAAWKNLPPFKYLSAIEVRQQWRRSLENLKLRIKHPDVEAEGYKVSWESRMYAILLAVERFEDAFAALKENFDVNMIQKEKSSQWMINTIGDEMGERFSLITNLLEINEEEIGDRDRDDLDGLADLSQPNSPNPVSGDVNSNREEPILAGQDLKPVIARRGSKMQEEAEVQHKKRFRNFRKFFSKRLKQSGK